MTPSLVPPTTSCTSPPLSRTQNNSCSFSFHRVEAHSDKLAIQFNHRRIFMYGLIAAGFGSMSTPESASAAKRRPPPPPTPQEEKRDPNVSGVQAKVLASKKRKEAMKETIAKLREKGKPVQ
uniref:Uncharacterized protein n=1 Tax=Ananas comosus var. bracteatus TaxID=296719 RepID=A0A6V7Q7N4_ANACO|nr:unnamed protein product [Ananas comosus var. bracteatus]